MWPELDTAGTIALDAGLWIVFHGIAVAIFVRLPWERFSRDSWITRTERLRT